MTHRLIVWFDLEKNTVVEAAIAIDPDNNIEAQIVNDKFKGRVWGKDRLDQIAQGYPGDGLYHFSGTGGPSVDIYIVDTGIRRTHHDFILDGVSRVTDLDDCYDHINEPGWLPCEDSHGHGKWPSLSSSFSNVADRVDRFELVGVWLLLVSSYLLACRFWCCRINNTRYTNSGTHVAATAAGDYVRETMHPNTMIRRYAPHCAPSLSLSVDRRVCLRPPLTNIALHRVVIQSSNINICSMVLRARRT